MEKILNLPKVSFIVITHNFSQFVCDCLNSIKNQTYENQEIIVVDDLSKDDTADKIQNLIKQAKEEIVKAKLHNEIHNVLVEFELKNISLIISSDGSIEKISDLEIVASKTRTITEILYNIIVDNHEKYGCDFPDIVINFN